MVSTEAKFTYREWDTDDWGGYERVLTLEIKHLIGKALTQGNERTNGILRQQTGRWLSLQHATRTTPEQIWQSLGPDQSNSAIGR